MCRRGSAVVRVDRPWGRAQTAGHRGLPEGGSDGVVRHDLPFCDTPALNEATRKSIRRSWQFATDYRVYPPLPVWWLDAEVSRRVVADEECPGEWTTDVQNGKPEVVRSAVLWLVTPVGKTRLETKGGVAAILPEELPGSPGDPDTVRFRVDAETPEGPVSEEFSFPHSLWAPVKGPTAPATEGPG